METMKIIGFEFKKLHFEDGRDIEGADLYFTFPKDGAAGMACRKVFVSNKKLGDYAPKIGDTVNLFYNRFGKVDCIRSAA